MDQNLQILGLARKASILAVGLDDVSKAARIKKLELIISASDASEGAKRRASFDAEFCGAVHVQVPYTMQELGAMTGRGSPGTVGFLEPGLAARFLWGLKQTAPEEYGEGYTLMEQRAKAAKEQNKKTKQASGRLQRRAAI